MSNNDENKNLNSMYNRFLINGNEYLNYVVSNNITTAQEIFK